MSRIIVIGSINMDITATADRLPRPGETVTGAKVAFVPGGKGANQAVAAARAGAPALMVGAIGDDDSARTLQTFLEADRIDIAHVKPAAGHSGTALVTVDARGENIITFIPGANASVDEDQIKHLDFQPDDVVLLQNEIPDTTVRAAIAAAHAAGAVVIHNPAPFRPIPDDLLASIDYLMVNELEFVQFAPLPNDLVTPELLELKLNTTVSAPKNVVITLGRDGLVARLDKKIYRVRGYQVTVVDSTGAGDCFCGSFAAALAMGKSAADALDFANAAAALSVQTPGAGPSMPHRADIEKFQKDNA